MTSRDGKILETNKVDKIIADILEEMYLDGEDLSSGQYLVAALVYISIPISSHQR